jgi:hypothetical protein
MRLFVLQKDILPLKNQRNFSLSFWVIQRLNNVKPYQLTCTGKPFGADQNTACFNAAIAIKTVGISVYRGLEIHGLASANA